MRFPRSAGILMHPTSLPGGHGIGELGQAAFSFIDFLVTSGQKYWQILPLGPTGYGDSPYACFSAFAGNPLLIDMDDLIATGDIETAALQEMPDFQPGSIDFGPLITSKYAMLQRAARQFRQHASAERHAAFEAFCEESALWLEDYALFRALKDAHGGAVWNTWEWELASRDPDALTEWSTRLADAIFAQKYYQFQFFRQWEAVKTYANDHGVEIIGDVPIFVAYDSVDVWMNPDLFYLDDNRLPTVVAGVPPDYFSATGQLWGNPLYRWDVMMDHGYTWWAARLRQMLRMVDIVRLDHFRGFAQYWGVPAGESTAVNGQWQDGPGASLFTVLKEVLGDLPIIAEDLGHITQDVEDLRDQFDFPGMKILQFAFASDATNPYLPHNLTPNAVIYTGTHDNDTTVGWYHSREQEERNKLWRYLGQTDEPINWALTRAAYRSVAGVAIVPVQDVLGLGAEARMNTPGKLGGNWTWRLKPDQLTTAHQEKLRTLAITYGRFIDADSAIARPDWM